MLIFPILFSTNTINCTTSHSLSASLSASL